MKSTYDGLKVEKITFATTDIYTGSTDNCIQNVQWLEVGGVCVSEHDSSSCQDLEHSKNYEYITPRDAGWGSVC